MRTALIVAITLHAPLAHRPRGLRLAVAPNGIWQQGSTHPKSAGREQEPSLSTRFDGDRTSNRGQETRRSFATASPTSVHPSPKHSPSYAGSAEPRVVTSCASGTDIALSVATDRSLCPMARVRSKRKADIQRRACRQSQVAGRHRVKIVKELSGNRFLIEAERYDRRSRRRFLKLLDGNVTFIEIMGHETIALGYSQEYRRAIRKFRVSRIHRSARSCFSIRIGYSISGHLWTDARGRLVIRCAGSATRAASRFEHDL